MECYVDAGGVTKCGPVDIDPYAVYVFSCLLLKGYRITANGLDVVLQCICGQVQKMTSLEELTNVEEAIEQRGIERIVLLNISC